MTAVPVLADLLPRRAGIARASLVRDAALVVGGAAFLAAVAQVVVPLPFTPVPLTLATFGVMLLGAGLGPARGLAAVGLYLLAGVLGAPVFAGATAGWAFASFGYAIGFLPAAAIVGRSARMGSDRKVTGMLGTAVAASAAIYAFGIAWLMAWTGLGFGEALMLGMLPFLVGDALKIGAAALLLPSTWRLIGKFSH